MRDAARATFRVSNAEAKKFAFRAPLIDYEIRFAARFRQREPRGVAEIMTEQRTIA